MARAWPYFTVHTYITILYQNWRDICHQMTVCKHWRTVDAELENGIHRPYRQLFVSVWESIYSTGVYVAPIVSSLLPYQPISHIRPFRDLQTLFFSKTYEELRYNPCYHHRGSMYAASQLPHFARQTNTTRRTSVIATVFRSYSFGSTSPIRNYTLLVLRAFPVGLVLLLYAQGCTEFTSWPLMFIALHSSTTLIYIKFGDFDHPVTQLQSSCARAFWVPIDSNTYAFLWLF